MSAESFRRLEEACGDALLPLMTPKELVRQRVREIREEQERQELRRQLLEEQEGGA